MDQDTKYMNRTHSTAFWPWAEEVYANKAVSNTLLTLQDKAGLSVNVILWCCWCAGRYDRVPELMIRNAIATSAEWRERVVETLRTVRRAMKDLQARGNYENIEPLRITIKDCELEAEKIEITLLEEFAAKHLNPTGPEQSKRRARHNLTIYAGLAGAAGKEGFSTTLLHTIIDNIFGVDCDHHEEKGDICE